MSVLSWIQKNTKSPLTKDFKLLKWQSDFIKNMYEYDYDKKELIIKKPHCFLMGAKKTFKSSTCMYLLAYRLTHKENETHCILSSCLEQSQVLLKIFVDSFKDSPFFSRLEVYKNRIFDPITNSEIVLATKSESASHSKLLSVCVFDEIMTYKREHFDIMNVLISSQQLKKDYQKWMLSNVPAYPEHQSLELLRRAKKDEQYQVYEFKKTTRYSWKNEKSWYEAHPALGEPGWEHLLTNYRDAYKEALTNKDAEYRFKRFYVAEGTSMDENLWINPQKLKWLRTEKERHHILSRTDMRFAVGWDLSLASDGSAFVLAAVPDQHETDKPLSEINHQLYLYGHVFFPNLDQKQSGLRTRMQRWHKQGLMTNQNRPVVDIDQIMESYLELMRAYPYIAENVINVIDPAYSQSLVRALHDHGFSTELRPYKPSTTIESIRRLERLSRSSLIKILERKNEFLIWSCKCCIINNKSKGWALVSRIQADHSIDYWVASILAYSELLKPRHIPLIDAF